MVAAMKRILLPALAAAACSVPAAAAERRFMVVDFDRVQVEGPYQVTLSTGGPSMAAAAGSQAALERVSIEVQGTTLHVRPNRSAWGGNPRDAAGPVAIRIGTRALRSAAVTGGGSLSVDRARGLRIDLTLSGSGRLAVAGIDADLLVVGLIGSGKIALAGKAKQLRASIQGSGDLDGVSFRADDADIGADTAGAIAVAAVRTARVRASGSGEVTISGSPACTVTGLAAGAVRCGAGQ
jgi:uncharacterized protein YodC (DUF2158 family)